jgi:regulator of replication initiation timing
MKLKLFILLFISTVTFAQKVTTSIDSTKKKIGSEFKLTIKTDVDTFSKVKFPESKLFGNLEVLESYKIDTIRNGNRYELIKNYGLTQFDSGKYLVPRLPIIINGKTVYTDSLKIEIADIKVDTLKQKLYDIKTIIPVEYKTNWWWFLLIPLVLAIAGLIYYLVTQKKTIKEKPVEIVYKSPIEKATTLLQQLEQKGLWQRGEVKNYYSELTDIARNYIEEEIQIPAMESTTSELILGLRNAAKQKKLKLSSETVENLEKVLQQADLVKFAKVTPLDYEIEEDKKRISNSIVTIHQSIPEIVEETDELELWNEQQKEKARLEKLKKEKQQRTVKIASSVLGILVLGLAILIYSKGFENVKDAVFGNQTKELAQGEWIYSDYGNPNVKIETPKVLKRLDAKQVMPKNAMALIKDMQLFAYGNLNDDFYVAVSTSMFKQETEIDLEQAAEGSLKIFETLGATNIIVKVEEFDTQQGIKGRKAFGTLVMVDKSSGKSTKMYYEILVFGQSNGLQQITVLHREDDKYGKEILDRILNSVELQNISQP